MGKASPVAKTVRDYSEASTIHGISYVFSTLLPLVDRTLWVLITFTCLSLAAYWSVTAYGNWQESLDAVKDKLMKDFKT